MNHKDVSAEDKGDKKSSSVKRVSLISLALIIIVLLLGSSVYFYLEYQKSQTLLNNPSRAGSDEINTLLAKVGKIYVLPTGDQPTLATVSDIGKLKGQSFFAKAENGDKVLIYPKTGVAILYRPSIDKIITVGPVSTQQTTASTSAILKLSVYNGTSTTGLTTKVTSDLAALSSLKTTVVSKANAANSYIDSVVVDLTGKNQSAASELAVFAKGKVGVLPVGEIKPEGADILIILGASYVGMPSVTPVLTPAP